MPKRYLLVVSTFLLSVLLYVDRAAIQAAREDITTKFQLSDIHFAWILAAFGFGYALMQTPSGRLADILGPRKVLTGVVIFWSIFTGMTGAAWNYVSLFIARFLFGAGEAGAFPGMARAIYSWVPMKERGIVQGINFSGSRIGAALALPIVAVLISGFHCCSIDFDGIGWENTFFLLMGIGFIWSVIWYAWFRDDPAEKNNISPAELEFIKKNRQHSRPDVDVDDNADIPPLRLGNLVKSKNMWWLSIQYFCSNFTFFFCLSWLFPFLKDTFHGLDDVTVGLYSALPFVAGALGSWFSGWLIDRIYHSGHWVASRRIPAITGFLLAAVGTLGSIFMIQYGPIPPIIAFSIAIFGADMTLSPSWSACIDIGRKNAGVVSGTMNMIGNVGSVSTALAYAYMKEYSLVPTGLDDTAPYFILAALLNVVAIGMWLLTKPTRVIEEY